MGEVIEMIPSMTRVKKEMEGLRSLLARMRKGELVITERGVDVTAREVRILDSQIEALDLTLRMFPEMGR